ncbi:hypothetical protein [Alcanivorax sp.]|uniref:hypothetical protein n=1 Tax=Alcanivorax sp. TaxID=1872427 RepID=UPI003A952F6B
MNLTPETIQKLAVHRTKPLGASDKTMKRAQHLVLVKAGKGKKVPLALRETTAYVARETDK